MRYQLRVELQGVRPAIWRAIWVEAQMSLGELHHIIQAAMGWTDAHLHEFEINGVRYGKPDPDDLAEVAVVDERRVLLSDVLTASLQFTYLYDFGDDWMHQVRVEQAEPQDEPYGAAFVHAGDRACPPEDSGGPSQYQEFLNQLAADPQSDDVQSFMRWAGEDFNPELYDRRGANAALLRLAWNGWGKK